jgi:methionyl-tRNA formyltransferase
LAIRVGIIGNQGITKTLITELLNRKVQIICVLSVDETLAEKATDFSDMASLCKNKKIPYLRSDSFRLSNLSADILKKLSDCDVVLVYGWQMLIEEAVLSLPRYGTFGVHGGPYPPPRCRGRAVFNWALISGEEYFHMYVFKLSAGTDDGDIFGIKSFTISPVDDIQSVLHKSSVISCQLFMELLSKLENGVVNGLPQSKSGATYLPGRRPEHSGISWKKSAHEIDRLIRAVGAPYSGAFSFHGESKITIRRAQVFDVGISFDKQPGEIVFSFPNGDFVVNCGNGIGLLVREYEAGDLYWQPEVASCFEVMSGVDGPEFAF